MPRPMNLHALADIHATAERIDRQQREAARQAIRGARETRTPRPAAVMPDVRPGDDVVLWTGATVRVAKVNAKSITTTTGTRYTAGEITGVVRRLS